MNTLHGVCKEKLASAATKAELESSGAIKARATPPMLPSPASIAGTKSSNSTPSNEGTPDSNVPTSSNLNANLPAPHPPNQTLIPQPLLPQRYRDVAIPVHVMDAMLEVTVTAAPPLVQNLKNHMSGTTAAGYCMTQSQRTLNIPVLARFFPNTFARVIHTTLSPLEEYEPDFEDEEGELFWPGQTCTGEGLGWVCLLGKAMINEFGKTCGYRGIDGVVSKPKVEGDDGYVPPPPGHPQQQREQRPGSTPHGHTPQGYSTPHGTHGHGSHLHLSNQR